MLVKNWMNVKVVKIRPSESILQAAEMMKEHGIKMMPVMDGDKLLGVLTDRDLKHASASKASSLESHELLYLLAKVTVKEIMAAPAITVPFDYTLDEAAGVLLDKKISGAPVLDHSGAVVGVINQEDIFRALTALTGLSKRGIQFGITLKNKPGSIKDVADVIRKYGGRIASILSTFEQVPESERTVYFRMYGIDRRELPKIKNEIRQYGRLHYVVDLRDQVREIFED